ncbi:hypothetical protein FRB94_004561 [Tulasnella sp. JGI-2019a]|nr:hypothetical protein FRB94_004561 [Tulasnella sp. JGI-2019a]
MDVAANSTVPSPHDEFKVLVEEMTTSVSAAKNVVRTLLDKHQKDSDALQFKDGISLLTLKNNILLSYLQSLTLLSAHRILGHTLVDRTSPSQPFSSTSRDARGSDAGDLVDSLVEGRTILEKAKTLEGKMRYQIDKLVRMAKETPNSDSKDVLSDPLAFRPNPDNLVDQGGQASGSGTANGIHPEPSGDGNQIYRPPKIARVPYTDPQDKKRQREAPAPNALASLSNYDPSNPYMESTSGLGSDPASMSKRQKELSQMARYEEDNLTRVVLNRSETRRRLRDEADIALGGGGNTGKLGHAGDFEGEFTDVLKSIGGNRSSQVGDGYETLRAKAKTTTLERSRTRKRDDLDFADDGEDSRRGGKKGRFEKDIRKEGRRRQGRR